MGKRDCSWRIRYYHYRYEMDACCAYSLTRVHIDIALRNIANDYIAFGGAI